MKSVKSIYYLIPATLVILGVVLLVVNFKDRQNQGMALIPQTKSQIQSITYDQYKQQLLGILNKYPMNVFKTKDGAEKLRTELLAMDHLPPEAQPTQLLLVLAADKVMAGKDAESEVILEELGNKYIWLEVWLKA